MALYFCFDQNNQEMTTARNVEFLWSVSLRNILNYITNISNYSLIVMVKTNKRYSITSVDLITASVCWMKGEWTNNFKTLPILSTLKECELYILAADLPDSNSDRLIQHFVNSSGKSFERHRLLFMCKLCSMPLTLLKSHFGPKRHCLHEIKFETYPKFITLYLSLCSAYWLCPAAVTC